MTFTRWAIWLAVLCLAPLVGCRSLLGEVTPRPVVAAGATVPMQVVKDATGSVLVTVPVAIRGQGPYTFILDTGASRTVIDRQVAERLGLETVPAITIASDVSGSLQATVVRVSDWRAGDVDLPSAIVASVDLGGPNGPALQQLLSQRFDGLLGSDILSGFGAITIDYAGGALILSPASQ